MTASRPARRRSGYTLVELMVTMGVLVSLGALVAPNLRTTSRDVNVKAGTDVVRARMEEARANAMSDARAYRLSVSPDGTQVRVAPDVTDDGSAVPESDDHAPFQAEVGLPKGVTAVPVAADAAAQPDADGWLRVATFLPDGTCKEDHATVEIREAGCYTMVVRLRGLTGAVTAAPAGANR